MVKIEEHNDMANKVRLLIQECFNNGCNGINCKECVLHKTDDDLADCLCDIIYHIGRDE